MSTAAIPTAAEITDDLFRRLRCRNTANGIVMLCNIGDGAGFNNTGWSDAISMQTWPSKGLIVTGYEVKATRSDWLRELDSPFKNRTWQEQCHEWYVVAPKDIVKPEELPSGWGLMIPQGADGIRIAIRSNSVGRDAVPLDLLAAVFRAAGRDLSAGRDRERIRIRDEFRAEFGSELREAKQESREWQQKYRELADALGNPWERTEELKARATVVRTTNPETLIQRASSMRRELEIAAKDLARAEEALRSTQEPTGMTPSRSPASISSRGAR